VQFRRKKEFLISKLMTRLWLVGCLPAWRDVRMKFENEK